MFDQTGWRKNTSIISTTGNGPKIRRVFIHGQKRLIKEDIFWGIPARIVADRAIAKWSSRVACTVRWPSKSRVGRVSDAFFAALDFLPERNCLSLRIPHGRRTRGGLFFSGIKISVESMRLLLWLTPKLTQVASAARELALRRAAGMTHVGRWVQRMVRQRTVPLERVLPLARPATIPRARVAETGPKGNSYHFFLATLYQRARSPPRAGGAD